MPASFVAHDCTRQRPSHGGNLEEIAVRYGRTPEELIDFSANINPAGPPSGVLSRLKQLVKDPGMLARYPDPDCRALRDALSVHLGVESRCIVVANGSAALLDVVLRALRPKECLLPIPAFSEYYRALLAANVGCSFFQLDANRNFELEAETFVKTSMQDRCDFWIISNPHNPSGSVIAPRTLLDIAAKALEFNATVLVDEAFIDYCPELSLSQSAVTLRNVIVLRSLTKFYGLAGLRVGFAVTNQDYADLLHVQLPSWPVSNFAMVAAIEALLDGHYAKRTLSSCRSERDWLAEHLVVLGLQPFPSAANFILVKLPVGAPPAACIRESLITGYSIVIRDCSSYGGLEPEKYFRIAVRDHAANERLIHALKEVLAS
jgi:threonine-phosphate decarboxylase